MDMLFYYAVLLVQIIQQGELLYKKLLTHSLLL